MVAEAIFRRESLWRSIRRGAAAQGGRGTPLLLTLRVFAAPPKDGLGRKRQWTHPPPHPAAHTLQGEYPRLPRCQSIGDTPLVQRIPDSAVGALIPASGSGPQVLHCLGGPLDWFRRFILSMAGAVLLYNVSPICTILAAFYWAWAPLWSAALGNLIIRLKYPFAGVWLAQVVSCNPLPGSEGRTRWRLVIGDHSGTSVEMVVERLQLPRQGLQRGEAAQLVVVSDTPSLSRFRALREVFLPRRGIWVGEQPHLERVAFEALQSRLPLRRPLLADLAGQESDDEDWDSLYSMLSDEASQTLRDYSYEDLGPAGPGGAAADADGIALGLLECGHEGGGGPCDVAFSELPPLTPLVDSGDPEICDRYREVQ